MNKNTDLLIVGGGLAGLSLALQARTSCPDIKITLIETRAKELPQFIGKVGESTVEVGAHYLADIIGQRKHLDEKQYRKFGLRFFFNDGCDDLSQADEVGTSDTFDIPTYQIERSSFENHLMGQLSLADVSVEMGSRVTDIDVGKGSHTVSLRNEHWTSKIQAKWVVDASGRSNLLRRKLQLDKPVEHKGSAVWFRVDKKISVDDWSSNQNWREKFGKDKRWLSTNHLMGRGYWIWIIPLAGGATSVGIVFDDKEHPWSDFAKYDRTLTWLKQHQPLCAAALEGCVPLDYRVLKSYTGDSTQIISADGWGMTGEAGTFIDPFYSPGTDFIAYNNTFLTDLISRESRGESIQGRSYLYQNIFESITKSTELLYRNQVVGFGSQRMMSLKMVWDYSYYWGVLSFIFFSKSLTNLELVRAMNPGFSETKQINESMQMMFRRYAKEGRRSMPQGHFVNQLEIPILCEFNVDLEQSVRGENLLMTLNSHVEKIRRVAKVIEALLLADSKGSINGAGSISENESELVGDLRLRLAS